MATTTGPRRTTSGGGTGTVRSIRPTLTTSSGAPLAGRAVTFTIGTTTLCTATTNAQGKAVCASGVLTGIQALLSGGYTVSFPGDNDYLPSSGKGSIATVAVLVLLP